MTTAHAYFAGDELELRAASPELPRLAAVARLRELARDRRPRIVVLANEKPPIQVGLEPVQTGGVFAGMLVSIELAGAELLPDLAEVVGVRRGARAAARAAASALLSLPGPLVDPS